jgi:hypothetical protein
MRNCWILSVLLATTALAQRPAVLLTDAPDLASSVSELPELRAKGFDVRVITGPGAYFGTLPTDNAEVKRALRESGVLMTDAVERARLGAMLSGAGNTAVDYLEALLAGRFDGQEVRSSMDWSAHADDVRERPDSSRIACCSGSQRGNGQDAADWTCSKSYNSEFMGGVVCASAFFIESNGSIDPNTYTWSQADIDNVKLQLIDAWSIWSYTASQNGQTVTAVMDFYEPSGGIPVQGYEPVTRSSAQDYLWIEAIMTNAGRNESGAFGKCDGFNHERRTTLGADHAYCAFIAYNPSAQGAPTQFTDGKIGYAYLGGPYTQLLYRANGWTTSQVNRVYGHETGHIFHAFDEYTASGTGNCSRSFNGRQNANFQGSTCNGTAGCLQR